MEWGKKPKKTQECSCFKIVLTCQFCIHFPPPCSLFSADRPLLQQPGLNLVLLLGSHHKGPLSEQLFKRLLERFCRTWMICFYYAETGAWFEGLRSVRALRGRGVLGRSSGGCLYSKAVLNICRNICYASEKQRTLFKRSLKLCYVTKR